MMVISAGNSEIESLIVLKDALQRKIIVAHTFRHESCQA
jgi:hypothetical protein